MVPITFWFTIVCSVVLWSMMVPVLAAPSALEFPTGKMIHLDGKINDAQEWDDAYLEPLALWGDVLVEVMTKYHPQSGKMLFAIRVQDVINDGEADQVVLFFDNFADDKTMVITPDYGYSLDRDGQKIEFLDLTPDNHHSGWQGSCVNNKDGYEMELVIETTKFEIKSGEYAGPKLIIGFQNDWEIEYWPDGAGPASNFQSYGYCVSPDNWKAKP